MTPSTPQRASFEEDRGPNAGSIMYSEVLYVKYHALGVIQDISNKYPRDC
jgi:hypothetical protein